MSNYDKKSIYDFALDFTEKEINKLKDEIAHLLETDATNENVERIEQRLKDFEKIFDNVI